MGKIEKMIEEGKYESLYPLAQIEDFNSFQRLKASIKKSGILNPIYYLEPVGKILKVVNGNTRIKAVKELKAEGIEVKLPLKAISKEEAAGIYLAENLQDLRKEYTAMQRAFVGVYYFYDSIKKQAEQNMAVGANGKPIKTAIEVAKQCGSNEKYVLAAKQFLSLFEKGQQKKIITEIFKERANLEPTDLKQITADDVSEIMRNIAMLEITIRQIAEKKRNRVVEQPEAPAAANAPAKKIVYEIKGITSLDADQQKEFKKKLKVLLTEYNLSGKSLTLADSSTNNSSLGQTILDNAVEVG